MKLKKYQRLILVMKNDTVNHIFENQVFKMIINNIFDPTKPSFMKPLQCIIIVSDKKLENKLIEQLQQFDTIEIIDVLKNKIELIEKMNMVRPDILFIDIDTDAWDYNEMINQVQRPPFIIGITQKVYNALLYLEMGFFDLLTPRVDSELFFKKMAKILRIARHFSMTQQNLSETPITYKRNHKTGFLNKSYIFVKYKKSNIRLVFEDILYVCNVGNYLRIELINGKTYYHTSTLKKFHTILPADKFLRINKSIIVNATRIDQIEKDTIHIKQHTFRISRIYSKNVKDSILQLK